MIKPKKNLCDKLFYNTELFLDKNVLKLDANENICGPSPKVFRALKNLCSKKINFYPCYGELLEELSYILSLPNEYFLPTNGCDEAISVIFNTYLEHGDNVVSFAPTFVMPKIYAEACGADFVEVDYTKKWELDLKSMSFKAKIFNVFRKFCYKLNKDVAVKIFGGFSLLVLVK